MKITQKTQALHVTKPTGVEVTYYLFDEYEVHYNEQPPHTKQEWHHHETIWETVYIIEGDLLAKWQEGTEHKEKHVSAGDLIETEHTPHTFENVSDKKTKFLVIKQLITGKEKRDVLKTDKVLD